MYQSIPPRIWGTGGVMLLLTGVIILGVVGYVFFGDKVADARRTRRPRRSRRWR